MLTKTNCLCIFTMLACSGTARPAAVESESPRPSGVRPPKYPPSTFAPVAPTAPVVPENALPVTFHGIWDVVHVTVDRNDQQHWLYNPDDPRLLGRELSIDGKSIAQGDTRCIQGRWASKSTRWSALFGKTFKRPQSAHLPTTPLPSDFDLASKPSQVTDAYALNCKVPQGDSPWRDGWLTMLSSDKLVITYEGVALLFLARRSGTAKPSPSFDCAKASNPVELAICKSIPLSAWDRSVAAAWEKTLAAADPDDVHQLKAAQKMWIKKRNECSQDATCIETAMQERTEELSR
jgi:uncharacterized protein YecT (DUF1311 family)